MDLRRMAAGLRHTHKRAELHTLGVRNGLGCRGEFTIEVLDAKGRVRETRHVSNLVVNAGLDWLKDFAFNPSTTQTQMGYIGVGSDNTAEAATDTALGSQVARQAVSAYTAGGTGVLTVDTTFAAGVATGALTEAALFDASSGGDMWNRATFSTVNVGAGDSIKVTITITFTAS